MSISKGVEFGSASVPEVACCSSNSIKELSCMFIFGPGPGAIPGMSAIFPPCAGSGVSILGTLSWASNDRFRVMTTTKHSKAFCTDPPPWRQWFTNDSANRVARLVNSAPADMKNPALNAQGGDSRGTIRRNQQVGRRLDRRMQSQQFGLGN